MTNLSFSPFPHDPDPTSIPTCFFDNAAAFIPPTFHFSRPSSPTFPEQPSLKRRRPLHDPPTTPHKKRRCRLTLITSRLSAPFAVPPTNIITLPETAPRVLTLNFRPVVGVGLGYTGARIGGRRRIGSYLNNNNGHNGCDAASILRKSAILNKIRKEQERREEEAERKRRDEIDAARREFRERLRAAAAAKEVSPLNRRRMTYPTSSSSSTNGGFKRPAAVRPPPSPPPTDARDPYPALGIGMDIEDEDDFSGWYDYNRFTPPPSPRILSVPAGDARVPVAGRGESNRWMLGGLHRPPMGMAENGMGFNLPMGYQF